MPKRLLSFVAAILWLATLAATVRADPFGESIDSILRAADAANPAAYRSANGHYDDAELATPGDVRAPLALALAAIRNQRLDDAASFLATARERSPQSQPAIRLALWLALLRKQYDQASVEIATLDRVLVSATPAQATHPEFLETARLLGQTTAFLKGPGSTPALEKRLAAWPGPGVAAWRPEFAAAFAVGKEAVEKGYVTAKIDVERSKRDALARNTEKLLKERQMHADQVAAIEGRKQAIDAERTDYRTKNEAQYMVTKARLTVLDAQIAPLTTARNERSRVQTDYDKERKQRDKDNEGKKDQEKKQASARELQLSSRLRTLDAEIQRLSIQLGPVELEANGLRPIVTKYEGALREFLRRLAEQDENLKTLARDDARLAREPTDSDGASVIAEGKVTAWRTYADLDFALETNRIRRTLKKP